MFHRDHTLRTRIDRRPPMYRRTLPIGPLACYETDSHCTPSQSLSCCSSPPDSLTHICFPDVLPVERAVQVPLLIIGKDVCRGAGILATDTTQQDITLLQDRAKMPQPFFPLQTIARRPILDLALFRGRAADGAYPLASEYLLITPGSLLSLCIAVIGQGGRKHIDRKILAADSISTRCYHIINLPGQQGQCIKRPLDNGNMLIGLEHFSMKVPTGRGGLPSGDDGFLLLALHLLVVGFGPFLEVVQDLLMLLFVHTRLPEGQCPPGESTIGQREDQPIRPQAHVKPCILCLRVHFFIGRDVT